MVSLVQVKHTPLTNNPNTEMYKGADTEAEQKEQVKLDDGFLKKVCAGRTITEILISEVYPYFPKFLECENNEEYEKFKEKTEIKQRTYDKNGSVEDYQQPAFNNERMREQFPVYNGSDIDEKLHHKPYGSGVKINKGLQDNGGMYLGVKDNVNNTDFPVVTMVHYHYKNNEETKHTLEVFDNETDSTNFKTGLSYENDDEKAKSFEKLLNRINKKRKQLLQVSLTPNNPDSSKSFIY